MIYLISGGRSSGKTEENKKNNLKKLITPSVLFSIKRKNTGFLTAYDLQNLSTREIHPLISDKESGGIPFTVYEENRRFVFNTEVYNHVYDQFYNELSNHHSLFLDEIGSLEIVKQKGFYKTLIFLIENSDIKDLYLTVSDNNLIQLERIINKMGRKYDISRKVSLSAVITASGHSSRFGDANKLLAEINGKALYQIILENIIKADIFSSIIIVSAYNEILGISEKYWNITSVYNSRSNRGLSESVKLGVAEAVKQGADGFMFFPCDQILLRSETIKK